MESYFVYVGEDRHVWRFVFYAEAARDGMDAIEQAQAEGRELGHEAGDGDGYMAVPQSAVTTHTGSVSPTSS